MLSCFCPFFFLCFAAFGAAVAISESCFAVYSPIHSFVIVPGFSCIMGRMYALPFTDGTVVRLEFWIARIARCPVGCLGSEFMDSCVQINPSLVVLRSP